MIHFFVYFSTQTISKLKKKIVILLISLFAIIIGIYLYINKDYRNIANEKSDYFVSSAKLENDFNASDSLANKKYLDKTINVKGKITKIDFDNSTLEIDEKVMAVFKDSILESLKLDQQICIKGRFIGYDDLFHQFRLDQAILE